MSDYIKGTTRLHKPPEEQGLNLAFMGLPAASMKAWAHLQSFFAAGEVTPCYGRTEWTSGKAGDKAFAIAGCLVCPARPACADFAVINEERGGTWGGQAR